MTHDELDPHKTDQRDRRTVEDEGATGGDAPTRSNSAGA